MTYLLTNIKDKSLTKEIIQESLDKVEPKINDTKIDNIIYISEDLENPEWKLENTPMIKYYLDKEKVDDLYGELEFIMGNWIEEGKFTDIIVDDSFIAYAILEIAIKKFNITEVYMLKDGKLEKGHPCGCAPETMGL